MKEPTMKDILHGVMAGLLGTFIVAFLRADAYGDRMVSRYHNVQKQAIERGYALYCPHDGEFAWVGECEDGEQ